MRFLYALLISLHPSSFRKRFAGEMLLIFDEWPTRARQRRFFFSAQLQAKAPPSLLRRLRRALESIRMESNRPAGSGGGGAVCP